MHVCRRLLAGQRVESVERRAKYLLLRLTHGTVLWHLGMSGSLRIVPSDLPVDAARSHRSGPRPRVTRSASTIRAASAASFM